MRWYKVDMQLLGSLEEALVVARQTIGQGYRYQEVLTGANRHVARLDHKTGFVTSLQHATPDDNIIINAYNKVVAQLRATTPIGMSV